MHNLDFAVGIFCLVDLEQPVKVAQEVGTAHIQDNLIAYLVGRVHLEGAAVIGSINNHHTFNAVPGRHIGNVELLAFSPFVADEGTQRLYNMVCVAAQLLGNVRCLSVRKRKVETENQ